MGRWSWRLRTCSKKKEREGGGEGGKEETLTGTRSRGVPQRREGQKKEVEEAKEEEIRKGGM
jgi:hypothetical protein